MSVTFTSLERLTHLSKATTGTAQSLIKVRRFGGKLVSLLCSAELLPRNTLCCVAKKKNAIACSSTSVTRICLKTKKHRKVSPHANYWWCAYTDGLTSTFTEYCNNPNIQKLVQMWQGRTPSNQKISVSWCQKTEPFPSVHI